MLLEIIIFLPIFSLTCLVCLWSDFDIGSYSLLSYKYMCGTYIDTLVTMHLQMYVCHTICIFIRQHCWLHSDLELHDMLMALPSFGSPVWVLDVRLYAAYSTVAILSVCENFIYIL